MDLTALTTVQRKRREHDAVDVVSDLLYGVIFTNLFSGRDKSFEEQAKDITDVVFRGILNEEERKRC